jgi:DNA polymerase III epsilon subunit-like protein
MGVSYGTVRYFFEQQKPTGISVVEKIPATFGFYPIKAVVFDLETTSLNSFFGKLIVASFLDLNTGQLDTRTLNDYTGDVESRELQLLHWTVNQILYADILIGHNITGFDCSFLNGRMGMHDPGWYLPKRQHYDTLQIARYGFKGRPMGYSLENLADFFRLPVQKDKPSKHDWVGSVILDDASIDRIAERCESDVIVNAHLWEILKPYFHKWKSR